LEKTRPEDRWRIDLPNNAFVVAEPPAMAVRPPLAYIKATAIPAATGAARGHHDLSS